MSALVYRKNLIPKQTKLTDKHNETKRNHYPEKLLILLYFVLVNSFENKTF